MHHATFGAVAGALLVCPVALAQHPGDISPYLVPAGDGLAALRTGQYDQAGQLQPDLHVFLGTFGNTGFPEFTADPGFDAPADTFVPGTRIGFHAPNGLLRWNGDGLDPVTTERFDVSFLTLSVTIGPDPEPGFDLAVQSNGGWHRHLSFEIWDTVAPLPAPGIYVLPLTLYSTDRTILDSELFWIVFRYQADEATQSAAADWIATHLVATPCAGDLDGDGAVGAADLAALLGAWGPAIGGFADLDADGGVGAGDLAVLLGAWGACP